MSLWARIFLDVKIPYSVAILILIIISILKSGSQFIKVVWFLVPVKHFSVRMSCYDAF